jgi:peptidoglycan hydrolase-like protein with peptidoglycan-binding domain
VAAADGFAKGRESASGGSGKGKGRKVRTQAGADRYGVAIGDYYTAEKGGQEDLEKGVKGERTRSAQDRLIKLGLLDEASGANGGRDGLFGPKTEAALREFQKRQGLPVTGKLDTRTGVLLDKLAPEGDPPDGKAPAKPRHSGPDKAGRKPGDPKYGDDPPVDPQKQHDPERARIKATLAKMGEAEVAAVIKRAKEIARKKGKRLPESA